MTAGFWAMFAGLFVVPLYLLWLGHKLRRRTARERSVFWGALSGHLIAIPIATIAAFSPPEFWSGSDTLRGLCGYWSLLLLPAVGAIAGLARSGSRAGN